MSNEFHFPAGLSEIQQWGEMWRMELASLEEEIFRLAELPLDQRLKAIQRSSYQSSGLVFNCYPNFEKLAPKLAEWVDSNMRISPDIFGQTVVAVKTALDGLHVAPTPDLSGFEQSVVAAQQAVFVVLERALKPKDVEDSKAVAEPQNPDKAKGEKELMRESLIFLEILYRNEAFDKPEAMKTGLIVAESNGRLSMDSRSTDGAKEQLDKFGLSKWVPGPRGGLYLTAAGISRAKQILPHPPRAKRTRF